MSDRPNAATRRRVLRSPAEHRTSPVPLTVTARTSTPGCRSRTMIARMSSAARSVSTTIGLATAGEAGAGAVLEGEAAVDGDPDGADVHAAAAMATTASATTQDRRWRVMAPILPSIGDPPDQR